MTEEAPLPGAREDGRRQRSERSRALIVEAMMKLVGGGEMRPNAAQIAETAGVGLRTVFRHFEDMDSLFDEMASRIATDVMPMVVAPYKTTGWRNQMDELITRRIAVFEAISPFRVAANLRRFESAYLMQGYQSFLSMERAGLKAILPEQITGNSELFSALDVAMSFHAWRRMRHDQGLSVVQAEAVVRLLTERLLGPP